MEERTLRTQDYLSLGYIYLVTLGILKDSIYYGFLGVNIISYSNILDVLLSPIAYLSRHPGVSAALLLLFLWLMIQPQLHQKYRGQKWYQKIFNVEKRDQIYAQSNAFPKEIIFIFFLFITSFFIGTGLGGGYRMKNKIKKESLEMTNVLYFNDDTKMKVNIIGQNSNYVFYVSVGTKTIAISPISGNIKSIGEIAN
ncbi:MAG: hypothetical protein AAF985_15625 [Bacteroidota bacterium]